MVTDQAIRVGKELPTGTKVMENVSCGKCQQTYSIIHSDLNAETNRAKRQAVWLKNYLTGEHVDENFKEHLPTFNDLEEQPDM